MTDGIIVFTVSNVIISFVINLIFLISEVKLQLWLLVEYLFVFVLTRSGIARVMLTEPVAFYGVVRLLFSV